MNDFASATSIKERVTELTGYSPYNEVKFVEEASNYVNVHRGCVLRLQDKSYYVLSNLVEGRFTLDDYPKYWVKSALELETGRKKILKWAFKEKFEYKIGILRIKCFRSATKESRMLDLVQGNPFFMQGKTVSDKHGNNIKVIDFIRGPNFFNYICGLTMSHEAYFHEVFPGVLTKLKESVSAIKLIHDNGFFHGDIRNDHILLDEVSGKYRWIDFDLNQDFSDFDIWSLGNILLFAVGMGEHTPRSIRNDPDISPGAADELDQGDMSAFFNHRIINLRKLFPYVPQRLNNILMRFSRNTTVFYEHTASILRDMTAVLMGL